MQTQTLNAFVDNRTSEEDLQTMWKLAKNICYVLWQTWKFGGSMRNFFPPSTFFEIGSTFNTYDLNTYDKNNNEDLCQGIEQLLMKVTQLVVQNGKPNMQIKYQQSNTNVESYSERDTPINVGIGLYIDHSTRSKKLIFFVRSKHQRKL